LKEERKKKNSLHVPSGRRKPLRKDRLYIKVLEKARGNERKVYASSEDALVIVRQEGTESYGTIKGRVCNEGNLIK